MDDRRFDAALRALQAGTTRRAGLAGALGVLAGASVARDVAAGKNGNGNKKPCSKATCPDGCCDGATCKRGTKDSACGKKGKSCQKCAKGKTCQNQQCRTKPCSASTCANGCCSGKTCVTATSASACGTGGAACASCSGATPICASGTCVACASNTDCSGNNADTCTSGICTCGGNPACSGATPLCSTGACVACASNTDCTSTSPICDGGTCSAGIWSYSAKFGTTGSGSGNLDSPFGVSVSADTLTAWVADYGNNRISVWTRPDISSTTWSYSTQFGTSGNGDSNFAAPHGVVVSADTLTAWVADTDNNRISIWTRPSTSSTTWSFSAKFGSGPGNLDGNFNAPFGVFVSVDSLTAWVADTVNCRISIWTRPTTSSTTWSYSAQFGTSGSGDSNLSFPYDLFVSADSLAAWVADSSNSRIAVWTRPTTSSTTWSYSAQFGTFGSGDSNFNYPYGVFVSADSLTTWVADTGNSRIAIWTRTDTSSTTWNSSTRFGTDGTGDSNFASPGGVFVSADTLTAWVADTNNNRIAIWTQS